jgi:ubiquinone/menaquinone biosynthesis C-methylase UbiE
MSPQISFGYPWFLIYGHLIITAAALPLLLFGRARRWPKVPMILIAALTLWSFAAFLTARFVLDFDGVPALPTESYLASGGGRVLDMGAGTGRSTLMVLEARPQTRVVALDLFGDSYEMHFGPGPSGQERLLSNLRAAGVEGRAEIQAGDMRELPFEAATFDAVVSAYAIDHLNREGITSALSEASRVLKPGGEFLLMVVGKEFWLNFTFGPLLLHSGIRSPEGWARLLQDAGFEIVEQGTRPATYYVLARKP